MKGLVQRVHRAAVRVDGDVVGEIDGGVAVFVGVGHKDDERDADLLADRILGLRIFPDDEGRMNRSLTDIGGRLLVVSQFTLMGDTRRGRRPHLVAVAVAAGGPAPRRRAAALSPPARSARTIEFYHRAPVLVARTTSRDSFANCFYGLYYINIRRLSF